ncbi:MAG: argininosuccinate synthase [Deltaproteobacteria bacterium]|nr:argininosuccinate synthase [Deltaproteobacteria bacterium]
MRIGDLKDRKIGICVSGGLDSKSVTARLREAGLDVVGFTADLAQPDEDDIEDIPRRMAPAGAETRIIDLKDAMAKAAMLVIKAQARYDGGYWNTTGIARAVTVNGLLGAMQGEGCTVLAHGATGRGNDQLRFERYTNVLAPDMAVYAAWRDPELLEQFPGRKEMASYLQEKGIEVSTGPAKRYSTDANIAGLSHEAEDLESLETPATIVVPTMGVWPQDAPDKVETVSMRFERGGCVELNGKALGAYDMLVEANGVAGRNGIGIANALENRIIGTKSRGVYEAPGMELLGSGLEAVYQAVLDRRASTLFRQLSTVVSDAIYDGRLFDPAPRAALAGIDTMAARANGRVEFGLYKGSLFFQQLTECDASLYNPADASMEASDGLNPTSSQGYVEVQSTEAVALANAGQIVAPVWED